MLLERCTELSAKSLLQWPVTVLANRRERRRSGGDTQAYIPDPHGDIAAGRYTRYLNSEELLASFEELALKPCYVQLALF